MEDGGGTAVGAGGVVVVMGAPLGGEVLVPCAASAIAQAVSVKAPKTGGPRTLPRLWVPPVAVHVCELGYPALVLEMLRTKTSPK